MTNGYGRLVIPAPSIEQVALIRRFLVAFAAIENYLRNRLQAEPKVSFVSLVTAYERRYPAWKAGPLLRDFAVVRNGLVHNETEPDRYLFVPLLEVVEEIERQKTACEKAEGVLPRFKREVVFAYVHDRLIDTLAVMYTNGYSQVPVHNGAEYVGLLTENGITRWLAHQASTHGPSINLADFQVSSALHTSENGQRVAWVSRVADLVTVTSLFITNPILEVVFITETGTGDPTEEIFGIVTAWDVARLE